MVGVNSTGFPQGIAKQEEGYWGFDVRPGATVIKNHAFFYDETGGVDVALDLGILGDFYFTDARMSPKTLPLRIATSAAMLASTEEVQFAHEYFIRDYWQFC